MLGFLGSIFMFLFYLFNGFFILHSASINRITELSESDKTTDITYECGKSGLKILLLGVKTLPENSRKNEEENRDWPKAEAQTAKKDDRHLQCLKETSCDGTHNNLGNPCGNATLAKRLISNDVDCSRPYCTQCCAGYYWSKIDRQCKKCESCEYTNLEPNVWTSCTVWNYTKSTVSIASSTTIRTSVSTTTLFPTTTGTTKSAIRTSVSSTTPFPPKTGTTSINTTKSAPMDTNTTTQSASSGVSSKLTGGEIAAIVTAAVVVVVGIVIILLKWRFCHRSVPNQSTRSSDEIELNDQRQGPNQENSSSDDVKTPLQNHTSQT